MAAIALATAHPLESHRAMVIHGSLPAPDQHEALLGRKLSPTPPHVANRALYIPSHNDKVTHLPVYEFTEDFRETIKDEPIGSSRFKTRFGLMTKPCGDGRGTSSVSYLLDFDPLEARQSLSGPEMGHRRKSSLGGIVTKATIQRRMLFGTDVEVGLTLPPHPAPGTRVEAGAAACTISPSSTTLAIPLLTSFPVPPTISKFGSSRNAWLTLTVQSLLDDPRTLQWQMHPAEHGMLRYTLVEIPAAGAHTTTTLGGEDKDLSDEVPFSAANPDHEHLIRAIYHNVGLGFSLSQPFSEGVLLLQSGLDPELEALILASLVGVLWRARNEESRPRKVSKSEASAKPARKQSVDEGESVASPGGKKGRLFSKILGKK
ncbi:unnamed protein product [Discula destructiva]